MLDYLILSDYNLKQTSSVQSKQIINPNKHASNREHHQDWLTSTKPSKSARACGPCGSVLGCCEQDFAWLLHPCAVRMDGGDSIFASADWFNCMIFFLEHTVAVIYMYRIDKLYSSMNMTAITVGDLGTIQIRKFLNGKNSTVVLNPSTSCWIWASNMCSSSGLSTTYRPITSRGPRDLWLFSVWAPRGLSGEWAYARNRLETYKSCRWRSRFPSQYSGVKNNI